jgi:predicted nucleotidyltransferase
MPNNELIKRVSALFDAEHPFGYEAHSLCLTYAGSHSHGTYIPPTDPNAVDDIDLFGIVMPPPNYMLGLEDFDNWNTKHEELDIVVYSLRKLVGLLLEGNPNVLGLLWLKPEHYLQTTPAFQRLLDNRHLFASKAAYKSFAGYANGQLHRMTSYTPEIEQEIQDLQAELELAGWKLQDVMDKRSVPMPKGLTTEQANTKANRLRKLRALYHSAYQGEKRRRLVKQHGYDTKNAAHLVRLLTMCKEFLANGEMTVFRSDDAESYKSIKRGEWELEAVKQRAETLFAEARKACETSTLPDEAPRQQISQLLTNMYLDAYRTVAVL